MLKTSRGTGLVAALMGATFLLMVLTYPRVEPLRVPDVLKLVASGMSPTPGRTKAGRHGTSRAREGVGHTIRPIVSSNIDGPDAIIRREPPSLYVTGRF